MEIVVAVLAALGLASSITAIWAEKSAYREAARHRRDAETWTAAIAAIQDLLIDTEVAREEGAAWGDRILTDLLGIDSIFGTLAASKSDWLQFHEWLHAEYAICKSLVVEGKGCIHVDSRALSKWGKSLVSNLRTFRQFGYDLDALESLLESAKRAGRSLEAQSEVLKVKKDAEELEMTVRRRQELERLQMQDKRQRQEIEELLKPYLETAALVQTQLPSEPAHPEDEKAREQAAAKDEGTRQRLKALEAEIEAESARSKAIATNEPPQRVERTAPVRAPNLGPKPHSPSQPTLEGCSGQASPPEQSTG